MHGAWPRGSRRTRWSAFVRSPGRGSAGAQGAPRVALTLVGIRAGLRSGPTQTARMRALADATAGVPAAAANGWSVIKARPTLAARVRTPSCASFMNSTSSFTTYTPHPREMDLGRREAVQLISLHPEPALENVREGWHLPKLRSRLHVSHTPSLAVPTFLAVTNTLPGSATGVGSLRGLARRAGHPCGSDDRPGTLVPRADPGARRCQPD